MCWIRDERFVQFRGLYPLLRPEMRRTCCTGGRCLGLGLWVDHGRETDSGFSLKTALPSALESRVYPTYEPVGHVRIALVILERTGAATREFYDGLSENCNDSMHRANR